jgi:cytoskeletal protein CcmA (bactofilin family)
VILKTAKIDGDVFYDALTIEQGAQVEGRFAHRDAQKASQPAATPQGSKPELSVAN